MIIIQNEIQNLAESIHFEKLIFIQKDLTKIM
jgi:hypothetical protein